MRIFGIGSDTSNQGNDKINGQNGSTQQGNDAQNDGQGNQQGAQDDKNQDGDSVFSGLFAGDADSGWGLSADDLKEPKKEGEEEKKDETNTNQMDPELIAQMNSLFESVKFDAADFGENFDPSNPQQLQAAFTKTMQKGVQSAISMMAIPVQAAMKDMQTQILTQVQSMMKTGNIHSAADKAFEPFAKAFAGNKDNLGFAKQIFEKAMKANRGDTDKAQAATKSALAGLGLKVGGGGRQNNFSFGDDESNTPSLQTGTGALDSLFKTN